MVLFSYNEKQTIKFNFCRMIHVLGVKIQSGFTCIYTIDYYILTILRSRDEISCSLGFTLRIVGKATTPISSLISLGLFCFVCPERQANLRWKDSGVKCSEHTAEFIDGVHLSRVIFTKSNHRFLRFFASTLSSLTKGIRWRDMPFSKLASFEQPKTAHLSGMILA